MEMRIWWHQMVYHPKESQAALSHHTYSFHTFNTCTEDLEKLKPSGKINGRMVNNLRYANQATLVAETEIDEDLRMPILKGKQENEHAELSLNIKKTQIKSIRKLYELKIKQWDNESGWWWWWWWLVTQSANGLDRIWSFYPSTESFPKQMLHCIKGNITGCKLFSQVKLPFWWSHDLPLCDPCTQLIHPFELGKNPPGLDIHLYIQG